MVAKSEYHETLEDLKGKNQLREQIIKKLKPESLKWIGAKDQALRDDNLEFYNKVKQAAIEQEKSNRLYQEVCSEKSSSSTKISNKHSKKQKCFHEKSSSQKQGSRDKSKKRPFGKEWECWGCRKKGPMLEKR
jgi:hypothetical protein